MIVSSFFFATNVSCPHSTLDTLARLSSSQLACVLNVMQVCVRRRFSRGWLHRCLPSNLGPTGSIPTHQSRMYFPAHKHRSVGLWLLVSHMCIRMSVMSSVKRTVDPVSATPPRLLGSLSSTHTGELRNITKGGKRIRFSPGPDPAEEWLSWILRGAF